MAFADTRIRSLETARECALLGARPRSIAWITGLAPSFILRAVFDDRHPAPRGRPPYSEDFVFRSTLKVQAEAGWFAIKYKSLIAEGFTPAQSLIAAFRHYVSFAAAPSFCFDEAFILVSRLDGIWANASPSLQLGRCRRCGSEHIVARGSIASHGCPFCKSAPSGATMRTPGRRRLVDGEPAPALVGRIGDELPLHIDALRFQRMLEKLGAHARVIAALMSSRPVVSTLPPAERPSALVRIGRPLCLNRWGAAIKTIYRVQYSLAAIAFRRLVRAGLPHEDAMAGAYRHIHSMFEGAKPLTFDRSFEVISLLEAKWGVSEPELELVPCGKCGAQHLVSRRDRERAHCPFCLLVRFPGLYFPPDIEAAPPRNAPGFDRPFRVDHAPSATQDRRGNLQRRDMSFLSFLRPERGSPASAPQRVEPAIDGSATAYPSVDPGITPRSAEQILAAHEDLISRVKLCYGSDRATFEADLLVPIRNFASFVNLLPATADNFYSDVGGLFRLGLEVGFFALQGTDGHIVSGRSTISTRRHLEPRWRHATFLAGLCCEMHRTLSHVVVTDERGDEWPAFLGPLTSWLDKQRSRRFFVRWLANAPESRAMGLFALPHIVPPETMQHLAAGNTIAVPQMLSCLAGIPLYREQNILVDLVKRATALVIDRNLIASANRYGRPILGAHLERYLLDAMRRLVVSHSAWAPNQERSRVWHGKDGLFLIWPNAVTEIRKLLEEDELPGIPKAPETILEILLGAGVLESRSAQQALWTISPPPGKTVVEAVKLSSPDILLPTHSQRTPPLEARLVVEPTSAPAPASAARDHQRPLDLSHTPRQEPGEGHRPAREVLTEDGEILSRAASGDGAAQAEPSEARLPIDAPAQQPLDFRLDAPMRLHPQVREALAAAIDSLNGDARQALAITVSSGVFVPLEHFKRVSLEVPVVLRALAEADMVHSADGSRVRTVQHELRGQTEVGFVLKPSFVQGLDPSDFAP